jgi:hypothetical protein
VQFRKRVDDFDSRHCLGEVTRREELALLDSFRGKVPDVLENFFEKATFLAGMMAVGCIWGLGQS